MKIVIIGQTLNKNFSGKIQGGIQTVERLHVRIFLEAGWDVFFVAPSCSEDFVTHPNFKLCRCSLAAQDQCGELARADKAKHSRTLANEIREWVQIINPDLVINHSFSSAHVRIATELSTKYPVLCFIHNTADTAMDIGVIAKVKFYKELVERGSALVCVSEYQRETWRVALRKRLSSGGDSFNFLTESDIDKIYDPFCYPIFINDEKVHPAQKHFIVISRPDPIKNVSKLLELSAGLDYQLHLFLANTGPLDENEYYAKKIKPHLPKLNITVHHNSPRQELLDLLATASGCFIPCTVEAAPVAFLEAASYGVRSIVFGKEREGVLGHAACALMGRENLELINVSKSDAEASVHLKSSIESLLNDPGDRDELKLKTYQRHSFKNRSEDLLKIASDVMKRYSKKQTLLGF